MNSIVPMTDEQATAIGEVAKMIKEIVKQGGALGGYLAGIAGTIPQDLVGILGGDWLRAIRIGNITKIMYKTQEKLRAEGVSFEQQAQPGPSIVAPILEAAADESRETLQNIWAALLAAASDPKRTNLVRREFIDMVKKFEPEDAKALAIMASTTDAKPTMRAFVAGRLGVTENTVEVILLNLIEAGALRYRNAEYEKAQNLESTLITAKGRELLWVLKL